MLTDLDIIAQLEERIGRKLEKLDEIKWDSVGYQFNDQHQVIGLGLYQCKLSDLPEEIIQLQNLRELYLGSNQLKELPASFGQLKNLSYLSLSENQLKELPTSFGQLQNLSYLSLGNNQLKELPASFGQLQNLSWLDLDYNQLNKLPTSFGQLKNSCQLLICGNPLKTPPLEIAEKGIKAIRNYFESLEFQKQQYQQYPLNEAKVIILGQGGVGKTSLVNRLVHSTYNDDENKTEGVNVKKWQITINEQEICLNVWDFGGQEIMHATHQLFLTKRSLYILLIDARQGEEFSRPEYWLKLIQTYGGNSPVLIVINKTDEHQLPLNKKFLQQKYENIQGFYNISCKDNINIETLKTTITEQIGQLPHVFDILPKSWFDLKQQLEAMDEDFITYEHYVHICIEYEINETSPQKTLIDLLHDLGIVLNFREDTKRPYLQNTNILKPEWATEAIYKLINCNLLFKAKGVLALSQLTELLDNTRYPQNQHRTLVELMTKFELCFEMPDTKEESYLIADLLDREEPDLNWNEEDCLKFEYHYDVLPSSIFSRFLVRIHKLISKKTYWFTGVMLAHENNKALIKADLEDKKIFISINGTKQTRRALLYIVRKEFSAIHDTFAKLIIKEFVPYKGTIVSYQRLLRLETKGKATDYLDEIDEEINVQILLNGLNDFRSRQQEREENRQNIYIYNSHIKESNIGTGDNGHQNVTTNEAPKPKNRLFGKD